MKKIFLVSIICLCLLVGCGKKEEKKKIETYGNENGLVASYYGTQSGVEFPEVTEANLYTNQSIEIKTPEKQETVELTKKEYEEILEEIFQEDVLNLKSDEIGQEVEGGYYERITLYYDGKTFTVGGSNIRNSSFTKVKKMLLR